MSLFFISADEDASIISTLAGVKISDFCKKIPRDINKIPLNNIIIWRRYFLINSSQSTSENFSIYLLIRYEINYFSWNINNFFNFLVFQKLCNSCVFFGQLFYITFVRFPTFNIY